MTKDKIYIEIYGKDKKFLDCGSFDTQEQADEFKKQYPEAEEIYEDTIRVSLSYEVIENGYSIASYDSYIDAALAIAKFLLRYEEDNFTENNEGNKETADYRIEIEERQ